MNLSHSVKHLWKLLVGILWCIQCHAIHASEVNPESKRKWEELKRINLNSSSSRATELEARARYKPGAEYLAWRERTLRRFREEGMALWEKFPEADDRYMWLGATFAPNCQPRYWKNIDLAAEVLAANREDESIALDWEALNRLDAVLPKMHAEAMKRLAALPREGRTESEKWVADAIVRGVSNELLGRYLRDLKRGVRSDIRALLRDTVEVLEYGCGHFEQHLIRRYFEPSLVGLDNMLTDEEASWFVAAMRGAKNQDLRSEGEAWGRIMEWKHTAARLSATDMHDGTPLGTENFRGKIVILDFWMHPGCGACVDAMPRLETVHQRYKDRGVTVLGFNLLWTKTVEERQERIKAGQAVMQDMGVSYKSMVSQNQEESEHIMRQYGLTGVPRLFLLNREGCYVMGGDLQAIEREILKMLNIEALQGGRTAMANK